MSGSNGEPHDRLSGFLGMLTRVSAALGAIIADGAAQVTAVERHEVRRAASVFALTFVAAIFACAAAGFAAVAVLTALGEEHRVLGAAGMAVGFALLSGLAALLARGAR